jgi:hypothetical protein
MSSPKPTNPFPINSIHLAFKLHSASYNLMRNQEKAPPKSGLSISEEDFSLTGLFAIFWK